MISGSVIRDCKPGHKMQSSHAPTATMQLEHKPQLATTSDTVFLKNITYGFEKGTMAEGNVCRSINTICERTALTRNLTHDVPHMQTANKAALSRALGAAFLSHQVQQLEKTAFTAPSSNRREYGGRDRARDRDRGTSPTNEVMRGRGGRRGGGRGRGGRQNGDVHAESERSDVDEKDKGDKKQKDADVVVVDASVLVNALGQLKAWCRKDREEIVVVPLEGEFSSLKMLTTIF